MESHTRLLKGNCLTKLGQHKVKIIDLECKILDTYIFSFSLQLSKLTKFWEYPQLMWMLCYLKQKLCMVLAYLKSQWFSTTEVPKLDQSFKITSFQKASGKFSSLYATFQVNIPNSICKLAIFEALENVHFDKAIVDAVCKRKANGRKHRRLECSNRNDHGWQLFNL